MKIDTEILDWIEEHVKTINLFLNENCSHVYRIMWIDSLGVSRNTEGNDLRDAVLRANLVNEHRKEFLKELKEKKEK